MLLKNLRIRLCIGYNLIFFACTLLSGCNGIQTETEILWKDEQAIGVSLRKALIQNVSDSLEKHIVVRLASEENAVPIFGSYTDEDDRIVFEPLIPFTRGLKYEVLVKGELISKFEIPKPDSAQAPELIEVYPTQDTVPENLLKVYLRFSKPMREGVSAKHVSLVMNNQDTVDGAFLDLQPELWSEDRTTLTLWLDPGRIKRDLQPNKLLGAPLNKGKHYSLLIDNKWKDLQGSLLKRSYRKEFTVISRDSISPDPKRWILKFPQSGGVDALRISLDQSLDYSLLGSTLHILDGSKHEVPGVWKIGVEEKTIEFIPGSNWLKGSYWIEIETRLEDLAGNNINRPFDLDTRNHHKPVGKDSVISDEFYLR